MKKIIKYLFFIQFLLLFGFIFGWNIFLCLLPIIFIIASYIGYALLILLCILIVKINDYRKR